MGKRINKSKEEIAEQIQRTQKVEREKALASLMWDFLNELTIYDAQTALGAVAGFIASDVEKKATALKVSDVTIDLSAEEDSPIKRSMEHIINVIRDEPAKDVAGLLERFAKTLGQYSAQQYMKRPFTDLKKKEIIA